jgi:hypothetical protein
MTIPKPIISIKIVIKMTNAGDGSDPSHLFSFKSSIAFNDIYFLNANYLTFALISWLNHFLYAT